MFIWKWTERHEKVAKCLGKQVKHTTRESIFTVMGMVFDVRVQGPISIHVRIRSVFLNLRINLLF